MDHASLDERLSQISTQWTLLFAARADSGPNQRQLLAQLAQRYCSPVYRYLLAAVRDPDVASDLAQEFALRFLQGDFRRADPERGRFRYYLKTVLLNLIADYHRSRKAAGQPLLHDVADPLRTPSENLDGDDGFNESWRETLLERTWRALENDNRLHYLALKLRVANPDWTSSDLAQRIAAQLGRPTNAAAVRKAIQRGHLKFADLLLDEVAATLEDSSLTEIEAELRELRLLRYCQAAVEKRRP